MYFMNFLLNLANFFFDLVATQLLIWIKRRINEICQWRKHYIFFKTLLCRSIENQYQFRFFLRKVIEWPRCLTYMYLSIKRNNDALKRRSNADFRFSDTSVCLTIDFFRIKLKQIQDFPLFSRLDVLKTVKIGKIVFTYPFYSSFVFYSKSLFQPWFNINKRFHILLPLSSTYVEFIEKDVKVGEINQV